VAADYNTSHPLRKWECLDTDGKNIFQVFSYPFWRFQFGITRSVTELQNAISVRVPVGTRARDGESGRCHNCNWTGLTKHCAVCQIPMTNFCLSISAGCWVRRKLGPSGAAGRLAAWAWVLADRKPICQQQQAAQQAGAATTAHPVDGSWPSSRLAQLFPCPWIPKQRNSQHMAQVSGLCTRAGARSLTEVRWALFWLLIVAPRGEGWS